MRLLVVTSMFLSGNGNWVAEQVRSLRGQGLEVDVIFFDTKRSRLSYAASLPSVIRALGSGKYDIVHTHHTYTMMQVDLARRLARTRTPVVLTNHESEILDMARRTRTWHPTSRLRHSLGLKRFAAGRADFVIFVARRLAAELAFEGPHEIIPCGVDLDKFTPMDRAECRRRLGVPEDALVIFFPPAPDNARKRFPLAQEAYRIVQGEVPNALMLTGGGIAADDMPLYYNASDIVLQTSFCEASPTIVKEALACEVPVVSTDAGDTRELLDGLTHCAVCREDARAIADYILAHHGRRPVGGRDLLTRKRLALEQVAARLCAVYRRTLDTHST